MAIDVTEKRVLFEQLLERVQAEYETALSAQKTTVEGATHEEAKPENDKDTRALEQSYLARGQAERVASLEGDLDTMKLFHVREFTDESKVGLGAFVVTEDDDGNEQNYLIAPAGAGELLDCSLGKTKVVTPNAPLGRALLGSEMDDDVEVRSPTGMRILSVTGIA